MATTQDNRLLKITTPLGKDFLLINKLTANESLSKLFSFEVELLHDEETPGYIPTIVDPQRILGQNISIDLIQRDDTTRQFNGIVSQFSQGTRHVRFSFYYATIVPEVWKLTQIHQSRIFQHKSIPDILKEVFKGYEVGYEIQGSFKPRNYCVQYRESDFDFASRLMEEEGIYYFFEHTGGKHKMIIANTPQSHRDCPSKSEIPYFVRVGDQEDFITSIRRWNTDYRLQSGKIAFWDHHFQTTTNKLDAEQPSRYNIGGNQKLEVYDHPGGYARKYDDIDRSGGERSDVPNVFPDKTNTAQIAMQAMDTQHKTASGASDCSSMIAGYRFTLTRHPAEVNGQYILTSITHEAEQNPTYVTDEESEQPYTNSFSCLSHGAGAPPFRPIRKTVKPTVRGSQTAMVVGPAGEEIFTDKYGRVKVQFHWDRQGKNDADSSCWVRVGTLWAGKQWGVIHIPRIGQEVLIDFIEGDPDQPIIVGSVYNPETMPPYTLPENKTQSGVKSRSSKGGGPANFNEFRFEDKKGSEEVYLHAEKDWTIMVENDKNQIVGHDETHLVKHNRTKTVNNDEKSTILHNRTEDVGSGTDKETISIHGYRIETVDKDETITVLENRTETVGKNETVTVKGNRIRNVVGDHNTTVNGAETNKITKDMTDDVGSKYVLKATTSITESSSEITITASSKLTLAGPGGTIVIDGRGITINGVLVKIN